jgi:hypothetical protein
MTSFLTLPCDVCDVCDERCIPVSMVSLIFKLDNEPHFYLHYLYHLR